MCLDRVELYSNSNRWWKGKKIENEVNWCLLAFGSPPPPPRFPVAMKAAMKGQEAAVLPNLGFMWLMAAGWWWWGGWFLTSPGPGRPRIFSSASSSFSNSFNFRVHLKQTEFLIGYQTSTNQGNIPKDEDEKVNRLRTGPISFSAKFSLSPCLSPSLSASRLPCSSLYHAPPPSSSLLLPPPPSSSLLLLHFVQLLLLWDIFPSVGSFSLALLSRNFLSSWLSPIIQTITHFHSRRSSNHWLWCFTYLHPPPVPPPLHPKKIQCLQRWFLQSDTFRYFATVPTIPQYHITRTLQSLFSKLRPSFIS